jgi:peptide/nickel transport system substrate-binding protein
MTNPRPIFRWLLLLLLITACLGPTQLLAKDKLVLALRGEPADGFDPLLGWGRYGNPLFFSTLLTRDAGLAITTDLATAYEVDPAGLVWRVTIRKDARFSDGRPLTAEDVAFTFNQAAAAGGKVDLTNLEKATVMGTHGIAFHLKTPDSTFIQRLITLGIVPKHAYGPDFGRRPVGSGPYMMSSWVQGEQMLAAANPNYYGVKPHFKNLTFLYGEEDTMFAAAKAGQVDMVVVPPHLGKQKIKGMRVHPVRSVDNRGLMFPMVPEEGKVSETGAPIGNNVTCDAAIRKAVNIALDREALVEGVLEGYGRPAWFVCDGLPWDNPQNRMRDADPEAARLILKKGGWEDRDKDGVVEKGQLQAEFTVVYPAGDSLRQGLAMAVVDMLRPVGIRVLVEGKSWDEIKQKMHANVIVFGWGSHDPTELYHLYAGPLAGKGYYNAGFYRNPTVDEYMQKAIQTVDPATAHQYWQKAQWDGQTGCGPRGDAPWAWLVNLDHVYFVRTELDLGVSRIEPHGHGWPITANITEWSWRP